MNTVLSLTSLVPGHDERRDFQARLLSGVGGENKFAKRTPETR